jgi:hypothetical protein
VLIAQTASARRSFQRRSSVGVVAWSTTPGRQPWRPSPVRVQHAVSTHPVPSSRVRLSSPSGVQPVRCPARPVSGHLGSSSGVRRPGSVVRGPAVRCPPVQRPAVWCPPRPSGRVRLLPRQAVALGTRPVRPGHCTTGTGEVPMGCRTVERLGRRPRGPGSGRRCRDRVGRWGCRRRPGWVVCGRRRLPAD